jgi:hypothetical protein
MNHLRAIEMNLTKFMDCFADKIGENTRIDSKLSTVSKGFDDMNHAFSVFAKCRLDLFESHLTSQKQSYIKHIKNLEKGHERKNQELDNLRSEMANLQAVLYNIMSDNKILSEELNDAHLRFKELKLQFANVEPMLSVSETSTSKNNLPQHSNSDDGHEDHVTCYRLRTYILVVTNALKIQYMIVHLLGSLALLA